MYTLRIFTGPDTAEKLQTDGKHQYAVVIMTMSTRHGGLVSLLPGTEPRLSHSRAEIMPGHRGHEIEVNYCQIYIIR